MCRALGLDLAPKKKRKDKQKKPDKLCKIMAKEVTESSLVKGHS
jgi:hypothetical protein